MNTITINGQKYNVDGQNISVRYNSVYVDGKLVVGQLTNDVHITFEGDIANLDCTSATINGNVTGNVDATSVKIVGNIDGDVDATSVNVNGNINGNVDGTTISYKK